MSGERLGADNVWVPDVSDAEADAALAALDAEQDREYEETAVMDADGVTFDPSTLAVDSGDAGLDDTDPVSTSMI